MTTTATAGTRRRYLGADFDALATFARSSVGPARPDTITLGTQRVAVDPWECDALSEWARSREESWQFLLVEGLALEARCACDLERAAAPSSMNVGIVYGYAGLVDGIVKRIKKEMGQDMKVIATGGLAPLICRETETIDTVDEFLTLEVLMTLFKRNQ